MAVEDFLSLLKGKTESNWKDLWKETCIFTKQLKAARELLSIGSNLISNRSNRKIIDRLIDVTHTLLNAERVVILEMEGSGKELTVTYCKEEKLLGTRVSALSGIEGDVVARRVCVNIADLNQDARYVPGIDVKMGYKSKCVACAPIVCDGVVVGILQAINKLPRSRSPRDNSASHFSANEALLLGFIAANVALSLKKSNLAVSLSNHAFNNGIDIHKNLEFNLSKKLMRLENDKSLQSLMDFAYNRLDAERVSIFTYSPSSKSLVCAISQDIKGFSIPHDKGFAGLSFTAKRVINVPDTETDERHNKDVDNFVGFKTRSLLCAPIMSPEGTALGVIQAVNKRGSKSFTYIDEEHINEVCNMMVTILREKADEIKQANDAAAAAALVSSNGLPVANISVTFARSIGSMVLSTSLEELVQGLEHTVHANSDFDFIRVYVTDGDRLLRVSNRRGTNYNEESEQFKLTDVNIQLKQALQFSAIVEYKYSASEDLHLLPDVKLSQAFIMPATAKAYPFQPGTCVAVIGSTSMATVRPIITEQTREILDVSMEYFSSAINQVADKLITEEQLKSLRSQLSLLNYSLSTVPDYVIILNHDGKLIGSNKCLDDLLGHAAPGSSLASDLSSSNLEDSTGSNNRENTTVNRIISEGMHYREFINNGHSPDLCRDLENAFKLHESKCMESIRLTSTTYPDGINVDYQISAIQNAEPSSRSRSPQSVENGVDSLASTSNDQENGNVQQLIVVVVIHVNNQKLLDLEAAVPANRKAKNVLDLTSVTNGVDAAAAIIGAIRTNFSLEPEVEENLKEIMTSLAFTSRRMSLTHSNYSAITKAIMAAQCMLVNPEIHLPPNIFEWQFNSLEIKDSLVLCNIMGKFFETLFNVEELSIDSSTLARYIAEVGRHYHDRPFHNLQHATCVTHFTFMLIRASEAPKYLKPHLVFAILLGAVVHDVDHPGNTNLFEINSQSDLAIRYNDQSVLENHHCSTAFRLMRKPNMQVLGKMPKPVAVEIRKYVISCVMATDMAVHFELIDETKKRAADGWNFDEVKDQNLLGKILLHAADLSNPVRPYHMTKEWARRISLEFNDQVKREQALGMPVLGFMMTPDDKAFCKNEMGFASFVVAPMWKAIASLYPNLQFLVDQIDENLNSWKKWLEEIQAEEENQAALAAAADTNDPPSDT
eukprot:CAMPEP_0173155560 /NCGR_PEP_ID=MMETSP1105-20130129/14176_1 /TAXON_ID=2985 /ORGANISM="Ochromonas sp., Strain BG-1" /LENGTH=1172 /DNA_ID=CAMNT_0014072005 /DNA_START=603 /DNA_END=4121 /DNA_ORIENTATION=-